MYRLTVLLALLALVLSACGDDESESAGSTTSTPATTPAEPATTTAAPEPEPEPEPDVDAAEAAARDDLPDIPLWEGTKFKGTVVSDSEICVDRVLAKEKASVVGGARTSHVIVSWPSLEVADEAEDGPCARREETADKELEAARAHYLAMDDLAIKLEDAVRAAQDEETGAVDRVARMRERIESRVTKYLLAGGDSIGGNLLLSAATSARDAARDGDVATLARQRREIADARGKLADEFAGR